MQELVHNFAERPGVIITFSVFLGFLVWISIRNMLDALLKMHRSKTAVKKIEKQYSFKQRFLLRHVRDHCLHAKKFCCWAIFMYNTNLIAATLVCILGVLGCFWKSIAVIAVYALLLQFFAVMLPVTLLDGFLVKNPLQKHKGPYRFTDHHNTDDHESLF